MNINDNKLNELITKTETTIQKKVKRRRYILSSSLAAAAIIIAVLVFSTGGSNVQDVVINNDANTIIASKNNSVDNSEIDSQWSDFKQYKDYKVSVIMDVYINLIPSLYNTYTFEIHQSFFTANEAKNIANYFFENTYYNETFTKDYFQKQLDELEKTNINKLVSMTEEQYYQTLDMLKKSIEIAPEENLPAEFSDKHDTVCSLISYLPSGEMSYLLIDNNEYSNNMPVLQYVRSEDNYLYYDYYDIDKLQLTNIQNQRYQEALKTAEEIVSHFTDDLTYSYGRLAKKVNFYYGLPTSTESFNSNIELFNDFNEEVFTFYFTRKYDELKLKGLSFFALNRFDPENYTADETIKITVDKKGLTEFLWVGRVNITKTDKTNQPILTYEEAIQKFKTTVLAKLDEPKNSNEKHVIYEIELSTKTYVSKEGKLLNIPVYVFRNTLTYSDSSGVKTTVISKLDRNAIMIINAIDGSIIE